MSTVGKVLIVLVSLACVGWIFLACLVADLDNNWGAEIAKLNARVGELEKQVDTAVGQISIARDAATLELEQKDKDLLVLRTRISKLEKSESSLKESLSRYTLQNGTVQAALESAVARKEYRIRERDDFTKQLADGQAELARIEADHSQLMTQFQKLQTDFKATIAENSTLLEKYKSQAPKPVRTASSAR